MPFYHKGDVRIRYEEAGSGFPLLVTPGGGLNSRVSNWPTAVFNAMEAFKNEFRCITMDQRNANGGEWQGGCSGKVGDRYIGHNRTAERSWSVPVMVTIADRGRCFAFVTRPDEGPYVRWTYRLEPRGAGTRVTEVWDVEQLPPAMQSATQAQLDERSRYTEAMLATTLAAIKATAEG